MSLSADVAALRAVFTLTDNASGTASKIKAEVGGMATAQGAATISQKEFNAAQKYGVNLASTSSIAVGILKGSVETLGGAFNHAKGFLSGLLTGPLGLIGLGGAAFGAVGAIEKSITDVTTLGLAVEKLTGLTGESATQISGLIAVTGKYGITTDQLSTIVGFEEKTLGKLAETTAKSAKAGKSAALQNLENIKLKEQETGASTKLTDKLIAEQKARDALAASHSAGLAPLSKLIALQNLYGVRLTDSKGAALNFSQVLNNVSDYYNSNATAGQKAALAATVFGRGYAVLLPVLKLGAKGFADAQQAASDLGLVLNNQNETDLRDYRVALRDTGDAVGGLQLQLGLALIPRIKSLALAVTAFVRDNGPEIRKFFSDFSNAIGEVGGVIGHTIIPALQGVGHLAQAAWNGIPAPLRTLLVEALVGNKVIKTVFGINILGTVEGAVGTGIKDILGKALGGIFSKGGSPANPLFVADVGKGIAGALGGGEAAAGGAAAGGAEAVAGAGGMGAIAALGATAATVAGPIAVAVTYELQKTALDNQSQGILNSVGKVAQGGNLAQQQTALDAINQGIKDLPPLLDFGQRDRLQGMADALRAQMTIEKSALGQADATASHTGKMVDDQLQGNVHLLRVAQAMQNLTGLTAAQMARVNNNLQLQRVAAHSDHLLSYRELLAASSKAHADALAHQAVLRAKIADLQKAEVGATSTQKIALEAQIAALRSQLRTPISTNVANIGALMKLQATKDAGSSIKVTATVSHTQNTIAASKAKRAGVA